MTFWNLDFGIYFMIPAQACLPPALPVGCVVKSSAFSWTINPLPRMSLVASPQPIHHWSVVRLILALPEASAVKFPISPLWYSPSPHLPCCLKVGFQWPPAELASAAEQSAFSWMWIAWTPGFKPERLTFMVTLPLCSLNVAMPPTVLPLRGSSLIITLFLDWSPLLVLHPTAIAKKSTDENRIFFMTIVLVFSKLIMARR